MFYEKLFTFFGECYFYKQITLLFHPIKVRYGISDWHNMIGVLVKGSAPKVEKQKINYRSYKKIDEKCFNDGIGQVPFHAANVDDDADGI